MQNDNSNAKKPLWFTLLIVFIAIAVFVITAAVIYNSFFKTEINKEKNKKLAQEYMSQTLDKNSKEAKIYREENLKLIDKHSLDIYGTYSCTFNELVEAEGENTQSYTQEVTRVMELKDDFTASFDDGTKAWWILKETDDGIVHLGLVLPEKKTPEIYMVCKGSLIDETKACFWGEVPEGKTFDATFKSGGFTLEFFASGKVNGEFTETVKENGVEYPRTEAYSGKYEKNGHFLDIVLNGAPARYFLFKNEYAPSDMKLEGFASRYYIKQ